MNLIDERSSKVLPDGGCPASDKNITITRCFEGCAAGDEDPFVELHTSNPERIVEILVGPGGVTIKRDRVIAHEQSRHCLPPFVCSHFDWASHILVHLASNGHLRRSTNPA